MATEYIKLTTEIQAFNDRCAAIVGNQVADGFGIDLWDFCACREITSPIEHLTHSALRTLITLHGWEPEIYIPPQTKMPIKHGIDVASQHPVNNYFVDFFITYDKHEGKGVLARKEVIVECDSQIWHERSEQERRYEKKRDRQFAKLGYHVFHFTGAEIMKEPFRVAAEVLSFLTGTDAKEIEAIIDNYEH